MRGVRIAGTLLILVGCGYSEAELTASYRDGHRAGIIWCKRVERAIAPQLDEILLIEWRRGFTESTRIQCASKARGIDWL